MSDIRITKKGIYWIVVFAVLSGVLLFNIRLFLPSAHGGSRKWILLFAALFVALVVTLLRLLRLFSLDAVKKKKSIPLPLFVFCVVYFPILWHFTVELIDNPKLKRIDLRHHLASIALCAVLFLFLFFLFRSLKVALWGGSIFYFVFGCVQHYTYEFRGMPLMYNDLLDTDAAFSVLGEYSIEPTAWILICFTVLFLSCVNVLARGDAAPPGHSLYANVAGRIAAVAVVLVLGIVIARSAAFSAFVGSLNNRTKAYRAKGSQLCFIQSIKASRIEPPVSYDYKAIEALSQEYIEKARAYNSALEEGAAPNILVIMDESFADIDLTGQDHLSERAMPFFTSLDENAIRGLTLVSTFGGGTCRSEFEYLTGNSLHCFDSSISPYPLLGKRMTAAIPNQLRDQGYRTVAIHPYKKKNYSRPETYAAMGFEEFLGAEDFEDPEIVRRYISDRSDFQKLCDLLKETQEPLFGFTVTMQNHGGYTNKQYEATVTAGDGSNAAANQYVSLIRESDEALKELLDFLESFSEPTIVVYFGDHLPNLSGDFYQAYNGFTKNDRKAESGLRYYQTPYLLWSNYGLESSNAATSLNYLGLETLKKAGAKLTPYQMYLMEQQKTVPAYSSYAWVGVDGALHEDGSDPEVSGLLSVSDCITYNQLVDRKHRCDDFYKVPE